MATTPKAPLPPAKALSRTKAHGCTITRYTHISPTLNNLPATFTLITPPPSLSTARPPLLYWLSGLTCTDENFPQKAAAPQHAARHAVALVCPDTSPRGAAAPREDESWDFGTGAGFYVDAIAPDYARAYNMASYVTRELPAVLRALVGDVVRVDRCAIFGHSMGGMGALSLALRNDALYTSASAFAPVAHPSVVPWGRRCFGAYLGEDRSLWAAYDPTELMLARGVPLFKEAILIDQGGDDSFLEEQLRPDDFVKACEKVGQQVTLSVADGYDHSYYFIQTFLGKHIEFHARLLYAADAQTSEV